MILDELITFEPTLCMKFSLANARVVKGSRGDERLGKNTFDDLTYAMTMLCGYLSDFETDESNKASFAA